MCKLKFFSFILLFQFSVVSFAQELYTDYLQKARPGRGTVVLHQSKAITDLINGMARKVPGIQNRVGNVSKTDSLMPTAVQNVAGDSLALTDAPANMGQRVRQRIPHSGVLRRQLQKR